MNKIYFIDSENVGDNWISLLNTVAPDDEILVFYTARSPHMNYKNLILLKQSPKEVTFIECCEGNNALDFQLCTDLGYRVRDLGEAEFIIVSNDTGFDAVVKYWTQRSKCVRRIPGKACASVNLTKQAANTNMPARKPMHGANMPAHVHEPVQAAVAGDAAVTVQVSKPVAAEDTSASASEPVNASVATTPMHVVDATAHVHVSKPMTDADASASDREPAAVAVASASTIDTTAPIHVSKPVAAEDASASSHEPVTAAVASTSDRKPVTGAIAPATAAKTSAHTRKHVSGADTSTSVDKPATVHVSKPVIAVDTPVTTHGSVTADDASAHVHEPVRADASDREPATAAVASATVHEPVTAVDVAAISAPEPKHTTEPIDARAKEILFVIGKDNLQLLHLALQQIFGLKKGKIYYNAFKSDTAYASYISKHKPENTKEKLNTYCSIVFELSEEKLEMPEDFPDFAINSWKNKKNLNSFKSALQSKYGKELSDKYYSMFKTHIKILDKIK